MARHYDFPDPDDRSPNEPTVIVDPKQVLGLYNQEHPDDPYTNMSEAVRLWFVDTSTKRGWDDAKFHGQQCLLRANVQRVHNK